MNGIVGWRLDNVICWVSAALGIPFPGILVVSLSDGSADQDWFTELVNILLTALHAATLLSVTMRPFSLRHSIPTKVE
jgi:hypothetical protein